MSFIPFYTNFSGFYLKGILASAFIFNILSSGLRQFTIWLGKAVKSNDQAAAAMARLKGALLTMAQPLVNVVIPAFITLVNILTRVVSAIANVVSSLFGTTAKESAAAAESLYDEQKALGGVGAAAEDAGKSMASFDEINQISGDNSAGGSGAGAGAIEPDFDTSFIKGELDYIAGLVGAAMLAVGAILVFSGANIPVGLALMAAGALTLVTVAIENWDAIVTALQGPLGEIISIISGALMAIGFILLLSGANIPIGLGLVAAGAAGLAAMAAVNWDTVSEALKGPIGAILLIVSGSLLVIGAILVFSNANLPLGLGLMMAGAVGLATSVAANWDAIQNALQGPIGTVVALVSGALLALGAILLFTGAGLPLGLGLIAVGAGGLAAAMSFDTGFFDNIVKLFSGFRDSILEVFNNLRDGIKGTINLILSFIEGLANGVVNGINTVIGAMNNLSFDIPDWVPGLGGKKFGFNIPKLSQIQIPRLARGAVIPPNREFMAVLGDQKHGTNIEAPADLIRQMVVEGIRAAGGAGGSRDLTVIMEVDRQTFGRLVYKMNNEETQRVGVSFAGVNK